MKTSPVRMASAAFERDILKTDDMTLSRRREATVSFIIVVLVSGMRSSERGRAERDSSVRPAFW